MSCSMSPSSAALVALFGMSRATKLEDPKSGAAEALLRAGLAAFGEVACDPGSSIEERRLAVAPLGDGESDGDGVALPFAATPEGVDAALAFGIAGSGAAAALSFSIAERTL